MKAIVDKELCIGCELCVQICPEVFSMNDTGTAVAIAGVIPASLESSATEAAEGCPATAIRIE